MKNPISMVQVLFFRCSFNNYFQISGLQFFLMNGNHFLTFSLIQFCNFLCSIMALLLMMVPHVFSIIWSVLVIIAYHIDKGNSAEKICHRPESSTIKITFDTISASAGICHQMYVGEFHIFKFFFLSIFSDSSYSISSLSVSFSSY